MDLFSPDTLTSLFGVIVVNLVLSGDNAVVIGMAAHKLHGKQRLFAIVFGGVAAVVLRIIFTVVAAYLLRIPALQFVGGLLLVWIAYKLLMEEVGDEEGHKAANSLVQAMWIITVADVVMSLDNILAIAALSKDNMTVLGIGLALSMAIVLFAGGIVAVLMERFPWINYVGSIAIAYVAGEMILKDQFVRSLAPGAMQTLADMAVGIELAAIPLLIAIVVPVYATWKNRRGAAKVAAAPVAAVAAASSEPEA